MPPESLPNSGRMPARSRFVLEDRDFSVDGVNGDFDAMALRMDQGFYDPAEKISPLEVVGRAEAIEIGGVAVRAERRGRRPVIAKLVAASIVLWRGT